MGREIKFKPATFYLGIADQLARVVEEQEHPQEQIWPGERYGKSPKQRAEMEQIRQEGERAEMVESLGKAQEDEGRGQGRWRGRGREMKTSSTTPDDGRRGLELTRTNEAVPH